MATRLIAAVLILALDNACTAPFRVRLDTGRGPPLAYRPPNLSKPVNVDADAFENALTQWVLTAPEALLFPQQGWLVRTSSPSNEADPQWKRLMGKSFGGICKPGQRRDNCLSLLDDVMGLSQWDKLGVGVVSQGMTGGAALLASRLSMLPRFSDAAAAGASQLGISLANVGQVSAVAVVGGTIVISLPATAVVMAAQGVGGGGAAVEADSAVFRSWGSFSGLSYEAQRAFGLRAIENVRKGIWK